MGRQNTGTGVVTGRVIVPSADRDAVRASRSIGRPHLLAVAGGIVVVAVAWPGSSFAESPAQTDRVSTVAAPFVGVSPAVEAARWGTPILLPRGTSDVVGLGSTVVAIAPDGVWPAWALFDGTWIKLRGIPRGPAMGTQVGVTREGGFSVIGVFDGRSVVYDYRSDGNFEGARTVREIEAGAFAAVTGGLAIFDATRPVGRLMTTTVTELEAPGTVIEAASGQGWLVVLTADGSVHGTRDPSDPTWRLLGTGFVGLRSSQRLIAVGENATVGIQELGSDGTLQRMDRAPFGPTVVSGSVVLVHDWSSDSIWASGSAGGWDRLPLWADAGFQASFGQMVGGAVVPTVTGVDGKGQQALWRAAP